MQLFYYDNTKLMVSYENINYSCSLDTPYLLHQVLMYLLTSISVERKCQLEGDIKYCRQIKRLSIEHGNDKIIIRT